MEKIGIYSGTFDPVHAGHLAFAREACARAGLTRVLFVPEPQPRGKTGVTPVAARAAALRTAVSGDPDLGVLSVHSPQFDVAHTLSELRTALPGAALYLLLGSDVAAGLEYWPDVRSLLQELPVIVGVRGVMQQVHVEQALSTLYARLELKPDYFVLRAAHSHLASSQLRRKQ